jgi:hypothetical protein
MAMTDLAFPCFRKSPLTSLIILATLTIGVTLSLLVCLRILQNHGIPSVPHSHTPVRRSHTARKQVFTLEMRLPKTNLSSKMML